MSFLLDGMALPDMRGEISSLVELLAAHFTEIFVGIFVQVPVHVLLYKIR